VSFELVAGSVEDVIEFLKALSEAVSLDKNNE